MRSWPALLLLTVTVTVCAIAGCDYSQRELLAAPEEQALLRAMQTRSYDETDERKVLRTVIATLQDLGFVIDEPVFPVARCGSWSPYAPGGRRAPSCAPARSTPPATASRS